MIAVYADETGTGGIPKSGKEPAPGVYGYLATPEYWDQFRLKWQAMLDNHGAPYFHFRELNPDFQKQNPDNYFSKWDEERKDNFIHDMAFLAGSGPIPFGGNAPQKRRKNAQMAYEEAFDCFFSDFTTQMDVHFQSEKELASFFFAKNDNEKWLCVLNAKIKIAWQRDNRIAKEYIMLDPQNSEHGRGIPCQAADMLAFVHRQNISTIYDEGLKHCRILDIIVGRKAITVGALEPLRSMEDGEFYDLIQDMRRAKKGYDTKRKRLGLQKKTFYPALEHPFIRELHLKWHAMQSALDNPIVRTSGRVSFKSLARTARQQAKQAGEKKTGA
ncbi:MAG TPA: hypothetical protein VGR14_01515 [Verrucomicrobiae bacterium]|nr:hypothetical protein [Verrucomicrobiae bacterium]